jgi:hypothetical protein
MELTLICARLFDTRWVHPDMARDACGRCGAVVCVCPSGQRAIAENGRANVSVVCLPCHGPIPASAAPTPEQIAEIAQSVPREPRR